FLFNGKHRGQVEIRCHAIRETDNPGETIMAETIIATPASETINAAAAAETISVRRGRPTLASLFDWRRRLAAGPAGRCENKRLRFETCGLIRTCESPDECSLPAMVTAGDIYPLR